MAKDIVERKDAGYSWYIFCLISRLIKCSIVLAIAYDEHIIKCGLCGRALIVKDTVNNNMAFLSHLKIDHGITYSVPQMTETKSFSKNNFNKTIASLKWESWHIWWIGAIDRNLEKVSYISTEMLPEQEAKDLPHSRAKPRLNYLPSYMLMRGRT